MLLLVHKQEDLWSESKPTVLTSSATLSITAEIERVNKSQWNKLESHEPPLKVPFKYKWTENKRVASKRRGREDRVTLPDIFSGYNLSFFKRSPSLFGPSLKREGASMEGDLCSGSTAESTWPFEGVQSAANPLVDLQTPWEQVSEQLFCSFLVKVTATIYWSRVVADDHLKATRTTRRLVYTSNTSCACLCVSSQLIPWV